MPGSTSSQGGEELPQKSLVDALVLWVTLAVGGITCLTGAYNLTDWLGAKITTPIAGRQLDIVIPVSVVEFRRTLPDCPFVFIVRQWVGRFADAFFLHTSMVYTLNQYCTDVCRVYTMRRTRMAFIAGCHTSEIPGSPDFTRPSICDYLERVFSRMEAN